MSLRHRLYLFLFPTSAVVVYSIIKSHRQPMTILRNNTNKGRCHKRTDSASTGASSDVVRHNRRGPSAKRLETASGAKGSNPKRLSARMTVPDLDHWCIFILISVRRSIMPRIFIHLHDDTKPPLVSHLHSNSTVTPSKTR